MYAKIIAFLLKNKPFVHLLVLLILIGAYVYSPIGLEENLPLRNPIGVDAIPNLGENQQIVSVEWPSHNEEIEDQITFPFLLLSLGFGSEFCSDLFYVWLEFHLCYFR